jgi:hypothetical protein
MKRRWRVNGIPMWYNLFGVNPMSLTDPEIRITQTNPSPLQEERAKAISRFNRLFIYTPIVILSLISLALVITLLYFVFNPPSSDAYATISGIADAIVIMGVFPLIITTGALLVIIFSIYVRGRRRGFAPVRGTQRFLWRVDWALSDVRQITGQVADQIARPFISIHAFSAYLRGFFHQLVRLLKRS